MNVFTLQSADDKSHNDQLINKINNRMKERFHSKLGLKLKHYEQLKKQLKVFKQKMFSENNFKYFNAQNRMNKQHRSIQVEKNDIDGSKIMNQEDLIHLKKQQNDVARRKRTNMSILEKKIMQQASREIDKPNCSQKKQQIRKRISISPIQQKILRSNKGSKQSIITINNKTLPLKMKTNIKSRHKLKSELRSPPIAFHDKTDEQCQNTDYQCKIRVEQLMDLVKQQQLKQYNKRCLDRLSSDRNKAIYEQALFKIYQIARQKMRFKQEFEVPKQLGINKIVIPKRLEKTESTKKTQYFIPNYERKRTRQVKQYQRKSYNERQRKVYKRKQQQQNPRNQTQCLSYRDYGQKNRNEQKINAWEYDLQNSKQFLI